MKWGRRLSSLKNQKHNWIGLAMILFLIIVGIVLLANIGKPQDLWKRAALTRDGELLLNSVPSNLSNIQLDGTFYVDVRAFSQLYNIYGVDMKLQFDKERLNVIDIQPTGADERCNVGVDDWVTALIHTPTASDSDCTFKKYESLVNANRYGELNIGAIAFDWLDGVVAQIPSGNSSNNPPTQVAKIGFLAKGNQSTNPLDIGFVAWDGSTDDTNIVTMLDTGSEADILGVSTLQRLSVGVATSTSAPPTGGITTVEYRVITGNDDAEEHINEGGSVDVGSSDLELGAEGGGSDLQIVGMRFNNVAIPANSQITNAYIEFEVDETDSETTNLIIYGELNPNSVGFVSTNFNISSRPRTIAEQSWNNLPSWTTVSEKKLTSNFSNVVQEIVNQQGWVSGNSMVIMIKGTGERTAESYNGEASAAPRLVVEYSSSLPQASDLTCGTYVVQSDGVIRQGASTTNGTDTSSISACYAWVKQQDLRATQCGTGVDYFEIVLVDSSKYSFQIPTLNMVTEFVHIEDCSVAVSPTAVPTATSVPPSPTSSVPTATPTPLKIAPTLTPTPTSIPTNTPVPTATPTPIKIAPTATPTQQIRSCSYCFKGVCDGKCNKAQEGSNCLDCP